MTLFEKLYQAAERELHERTLQIMGSSKIENAVFLDLGCGDCQFTERIAQIVRPLLTFVIDSSKWRLMNAGLKGYRGISADLNCTMPLADTSVDIIHAGNVIEHLNNTDMFIKEIKRILTPSGFAVITTNNLASWHNILSLCIGRQPLPVMVSDEMKISGVEADIDMPKHRRIFTLDGLSRLLKYHGLTVVESRGCGYYPFSGAFQNLMSTIDSRHAAYVLIKVSK